MTAPLLAVEDLSITLRRPGLPALPIVTDMGFTLGRGETLGIVGESGAGKSLLALALIGLLPETMAARGRALFDGMELLSLSETEWCRLRGQRIAMVFQDPSSALDPRMTVGTQIAEGLVLRKHLDRTTARAEALRLMDRVRLPEAAGHAKAYPHELSGGQRQRVVIATALALDPDLLVADEPTTALDVTMQAEILDLLADLTVETAMSLILISHDLGVIAGATEKIIVAYAGTRLEAGPTATVLAQPRSPYTAGLIAAQPGRCKGARLATIPGMVPAFTALPPGCRFAPRCTARTAGCGTVEPPWRDGLRCLNPVPAKGEP